VQNVTQLEGFAAIVEKPMATKNTEQQVSAAAKKAERERDGAVAMREYEKEKARIDANTERLRALRLAKEAADATAEAAAAEAPRKSARASRARKSA